MSTRTALVRNARRVQRVTGTRGVLPVVRVCTSWVVGFTAGRFAAAGEFTLGGVTYPCFHHRYHYTWLNERAVEIPVFQALVEGRDPETVLEVGNVLGHYGPRRHIVVDRYEGATDVCNEDVVDFDPGRRFELIVSISTLEHVGLDEEPQEPDKPLRALERLRGLLAPGGQLVFSIPVGYNRDLDQALRSGAVELDGCRALRRVGGAWREVACDTVWDATYDELLYQAEAIVVATVRA